MFVLFFNGDFFHVRPRGASTHFGFRLLKWFSQCPRRTCTRPWQRSWRTSWRLALLLGNNLHPFQKDNCPVDSLFFWWNMLSPPASDETIIILVGYVVVFFKGGMQMQTETCATQKGIVANSGWYELDWFAWRFFIHIFINGLIKIGRVA